MGSAAYLRGKGNCKRGDAADAAERGEKQSESSRL